MRKGMPKMIPKMEATTTKAEGGRSANAIAREYFWSSIRTVDEDDVESHSLDVTPGDGDAVKRLIEGGGSVDTTPPIKTTNIIITKKMELNCKANFLKLTILKRLF